MQQNPFINGSPDSSVAPVANTAPQCEKVYSVSYTCNISQRGSHLLQAPICSVFCSRSLLSPTKLSTQLSNYSDRQSVCYEIQMGRLRWRSGATVYRVCVASCTESKWVCSHAETPVIYTRQPNAQIIPTARESGRVGRTIWACTCSSPSKS